jgi:enamine deaminase RidA (YjgF/YER057c/UK114 family)
MMDQNTEQQCSPECRIAKLGIELPGAPTPFGSYVEALRTGNLVFLSGMLPVIDHKPAFIGFIGRELDVKAGWEAARIAALGALAVVRGQLGSLDRIKRVVRLGIFMTTAGDFRDHPAVADGASDLFRDVFGEENMAVRSVIGVATLPLGVPIEVEAIFEVEA